MACAAGSGIGAPNVPIILFNSPAHVALGSGGCIDVRRAVTDTAEALHKLSSLSVGERGRVRRPRPHGVDRARIISVRCRLHLHPEVAGVIVPPLDEAGGLRRLTDRKSVV